MQRGHLASCLCESFVAILCAASASFFASQYCPEELYNRSGLAQLLTDAWGEFFLSVLIATFLAANFWGILRKTAVLDTATEFITGRDWYPSIAKKFFDQNVNQVVIVSTPDTRYMGILFGAPDTKDDPHIILSEVSRLPKPGELPTTIEPLPLVRWVLVKFDDIVEVQALKPEALRSAEPETPVETAEGGVSHVGR